MTALSPSTIHVKLNRSLKAKLDEMAKADRRKKTEFVCLLIEDEWERRKKASEGNGHP